MTTEFAELNPPRRTLLGPGPSNVHPRVYRAMMAPVIGYLDASFIQLMDDTQRPLRKAFRTENDLTIAISGTGSAGMEAAIYNVLEPGDTAIICINGFFGFRMADMATRCGAEIVTVEAEWGEIIEPEKVEAALNAHPSAKVVAIVQAETSTGVLQPLEDISHIVHRHDALFLVDAVTSLGGCDLRVDGWEIDICYSATQKCLSAPPGMAPLTMSPRATEVMNNRKTSVASWYVDLTLLRSYWAGGLNRRYHHTPPTTMLYALREALRITLDEGLEMAVTRHSRNAQALWSGLQALGLELHAQEGYRLPSLTTVRVPSKINEMQVRRALLDEHNIEIGGGLGPLQGKVFRIGLMGYASKSSNVLAVLHALEEQLVKHGHEVNVGAGVAAASRILNTLNV